MPASTKHLSHFSPKTSSDLVTCVGLLTLMLSTDDIINLETSLISINWTQYTRKDYLVESTLPLFGPLPQKTHPQNRFLRAGLDVASTWNLPQYHMSLYSQRFISYVNLCKRIISHFLFSLSFLPFPRRFELFPDIFEAIIVVRTFLFLKT